MLPHYKSLLLLIAILVCPPVIYSQLDSALSFYPLQKGNYWQYRSTERNKNGIQGQTIHYYSVKVTGDTTFLNGKLYYQMECSDKSTIHARFQRIDSSTSQVFAYDPSIGTKEYVIDSLKGPVLSAFTGCRLPSLQLTTVWSVDSQFYFGAKVLCRRYVTPVGLGPYLLYTLARGIGITLIENGVSDVDLFPSSSTTDTLVYAQISGKDYGTLVFVRENSEAPMRFLLYQNYPNPFNPTTTISYQLSAKSDVTLIVFDVLGREVATLVNEIQEAGIHRATFSPVDVSTGMYFYRLKVGQFVETKKLMILK